MNNTISAMGIAHAQTSAAGVEESTGLRADNLALLDGPTRDADRLMDFARQSEIAPTGCFAEFAQ